jgi:iron-sulfur cluster repair protein YtfE (RIC family)
MERLTAGQSEIDGSSYGTTSCVKLAESLDEHFRREEQFLFPILDRSLGSAICDRLKGEHAEIMNTVKKLNQQLNPLKELFNHLEQMFRAHISTEENVLFWYLDLQKPTQ